MSIHVEPYLPDEEYDNPAMVTDFYEFTMANCLFLHGYKDTIMVFDMFYRENPDNLGYAIAAGQDKLTTYLLNQYIRHEAESESIFQDSLPAGMTFEAAIKEKLKPYIGWSAEQIAAHFDFDLSKNKRHERQLP